MRIHNGARCPENADVHAGQDHFYSYNSGVVPYNTDKYFSPKKCPEGATYVSLG